MDRKSPGVNWNKTEKPACLHAKSEITRHAFSMSHETARLNEFIRAGYAHLAIRNSQFEILFFPPEFTFSVCFGPIE